MFLDLLPRQAYPCVFWGKRFPEISSRFTTWFDRGSSDWLAIDSVSPSGSRV